MKKSPKVLQKKYVYKDGDCLAIMGIPATMSQIQKNTQECVLYSMLYASAVFGKDMKTSDFAEMYKTINPNRSIETDGILKEEAKPLMQCHFQFISGKGDFWPCLDREMVVMTTLKDVVYNSDTKEHMAHVVIVVGYTKDKEEYIFMDPTIGYWQTAPRGYFGNLLLFGISRLKNK